MTLLRLTLAIAVGVACSLLCPNEARACSYPACANFVAPSPGSTGVPLETSVVIAGDSAPTGLQLEKDGAVLWSGGAATSFAEGYECVRRFALPVLEAESTYVLTASTAEGGREELTRFSTSDQPPATRGTAPRITSLEVKVIEGEFSPSACFACTTANLAYVEFEPASIPGTAADSVLHAWTLHKEGEAAVVPSDPTASVFALGQNWLGCNRDPYPCWSECAKRIPGDRWCAKVKAWGVPYAPDGALESEEVCTTVVRVSLVEPPDAGPGTDAAVGGQVDAGSAAADAGIAGGAPGETDDASGCSTAAGGTFVGLALLALGVLRRRS